MFTKPKPTTPISFTIKRFSMKRNYSRINLWLTLVTAFLLLPMLTLPAQAQLIFSTPEGDGWNTNNPWGDYNITGNIIVSGTHSSNVMINVQNNATLTISESLTLSNQASFFVRTGGTLIINSGATLTINSNTGWGFVNQGGLVINSGTIIHNSGNFGSTFGSEPVINYGLITHTGGTWHASNKIINIPPNGAVVGTSVGSIVSGNLVTVTGGTLFGGAFGNPTSDYYAVGVAVNITANTPPQGLHFTQWNISPSVVFTTGDLNTSTATFTMPANAVTVTANFALNTYTVTNSVTNASITPLTATHGTAWSGTLTPNTGFTRPTSITMTIGGTNFTGFTYNPADGTILIPAASVTGNIEIFGAAVPPLSGTVNLEINPATGEVTASATGGNTGSAGTLTYTWSGGATGAGTMQTPALGVATTVTVTAEGTTGSISASVTVYRVDVTVLGSQGTDNASIVQPFGRAGDEKTINYTLGNYGALANTLIFSGVESALDQVTTSGTGTRLYTINPAHATSGVITITATFAHTNLIPVNNIGGTATTTFAGTAIDLTVIDGLFIIDPNAGARSFTIETGGTGAGTINGDMLTVTGVGTFIIGLTTAQTDSHAASEMVTATLTVNRAPITSANIAVTAPVKAAVPNTVATTTETGYSLSEVTWNPADAVFLGNTVYTATVTLTADVNFAFPSDFTATINGKPATIADNTYTTVTLSLIFVPTEQRKVTGIEVVTQPTTLIYAHGAALDLNGLVVRLMYDDSTTEDIPFEDFAAHNIYTNPANGTILSHTVHNGTTVQVLLGELLANTSALTVGAPPVITISQQPVNTTVVVSNISGSLSVVASTTDATELTFQWYRSSSADVSLIALALEALALADDEVVRSEGEEELPTIEAIEGATEAEFAIPADLEEGIYYFFVIVSADNAESVMSDVVTVTVVLTASVPPVPVFFGLASDLPADTTPIPLRVIGVGSELLTTFRVNGVVSNVFIPSAPGVYLIEALSADGTLRIWRYVRVI